MKIAKGDPMLPSNWPVPGGYRRTSWGELEEGDEVFLLCLCPPGEDGMIRTTRAAGPYRVIDAEGRKLTGVVTRDVLHEPGDSRLLRRCEG